MAGGVMWAYTVAGASGGRCGSISGGATEGRVGRVRRKEKGLYIHDPTRDFPPPGFPGGLRKSMLGGVGGTGGELLYLKVYSYCHLLSPSILAEGLPQLADLWFFWRL